MSEMNIKPFRFFTQAILPLDYDDTLSYYECLAKVTAKLNETINVVDVNNENMQSLHDAYVQLESFVNSYFDDLDVQAEIDNKLDEMVTDGTLLELIQPFVDDEIADAVAAWLEENITPTTPAVDATLLVSGAAADSKTVGDKLKADVAPAYSASATYAVGDYVLYDHTLYKCNTAISTAEAWTAAHWTAVNVTDEISDLNDAFDDMRSAYTDSTPIDLTNPYTTFINTSNLWSVSGTPSPKSAIEQIPDGVKYIRIKANSTENAVIAFLTSDAHGSTTTPNYATGTGRIVLLAETEAVYPVPSDAKYIYIFLSRAGITYQPSIANYESYKTIPYERIDAIENKIGDINNTSFTKPTDGNAVKNVAFPITANRSLLFYWKTSEIGPNELNLYTRTTSTGSNVDVLIERAKPEIVYTVTPAHDANYLRISANATGEITWLYADTIMADLLDVHKDISELQKYSTKEPLVNFKFDRTMINASDIVSKFGLTTDNRNTMFSAVYNAFSELSQSYPSYVTEILDAVDGKDGNTPTELEYPWYANGITSNTTVDIPVVVDEQGQTMQSVSYTFTKDVSAYKVRLYKLSDTNPALPVSGKKKVFIIGGVHGNEVVAPINLYEFSKRLCNPTDNADMLKLRASCDFYIIPYLNGFGGQYLARVNGNLTDINRNFPTVGWTKTTITESTFSNLATCTFSGKASGSEFETQLVMALHEQINPDVFVDHHNSGTGQSQFYSVVTNSLVGNTIYQALTDCASSFIENLPQYFGTEYKLFSGSDVSPGTYTGITGHSDRWSYEQGVITSGTCEIFEAINFLNGSYNPSPTKYNADAFSVGEYTLRNVLLHLCQYMLKH